VRSDARSDLATAARALFSLPPLEAARAEPGVEARQEGDAVTQPHAAPSSKIG
jgi:hypothetical protein